MAARYATDTFVVHLTGGGDELVIEGSLRDSAEAVVTQVPGKFSTTAPAVGVGHVSALLYGHLQAHPRGSEA